MFLRMIAVSALAWLALPAGAQAPKEPIEETVTGHVLHPAGLDPTPDRTATLKMPPGFHIEKFAEGLETRACFRSPRTGPSTSRSARPKTS